MSITQYLDGELGELVEVTTRRKGKTTVIRGVIDKYEVLHGTDIVNIKTREKWPAYRLRIKPEGGGRAKWTCAFPYRDKDGAES